MSDNLPDIRETDQSAELSDVEMVLPIMIEAGKDIGNRLNNLEERVRASEAKLDLVLLHLAEVQEHMARIMPLVAEAERMLKKRSKVIGLISGGR